MTDLRHQRVPRMPGLSMRAAVQHACGFLERHAPDHLREPGKLDMRHLIEKALPAEGVNVYPASSEELGEDLGQATFDGNGDRVILLQESYFEAIYVGGSAENRARATLLHEIPHAILHLPLLKGFDASADHQVLHRRGDIHPACDPDWQAWAIGCSLGVPPHTLIKLDGMSCDAAARLYGVSGRLLQSHVKRLSRWGFSIDHGRLRTPRRGGAPTR